MTNDGATVAGEFFGSLKAGDVLGAMVMLHPDCVIREPESLPYGGEYRGPSCLVDLLTAFSEHFTLVINSFEAWGGGDGPASVRAQVTIASISSGRHLDTVAVEVYRLQDGRIIDADIFLKDTKAICDLIEAGAPATV